MVTIANYINGELTPPRAGAYLDNVEPATGSAYSRAPDSGNDDVHAAVEAAKAAFEPWAALSPAERSRWLLNLADAIEARFEDFVRAESIDTGKPIALARAMDIPRAAANFRFFATAVLHSREDVHITDPRTLNYTMRQPRGVAACISPWNLPLYLFSWKVAPALATGNTVVGKPSELTPMTAFMLGRVCAEIGFPPGVLNIVHGLGARAGAALVAHDDVAAISFTGGTATGRTIAAAAAPRFKKCSLELGGKNPVVVFADADMDRAVSTSVRGAFTNQGQVCLCGSRIFVEHSAFDEFVARFIEQTNQLRQGDPLDESTQQGAVVSRAHLEKVLGCIARARQEGAIVHCGGERARVSSARCREGYFIQPTVMTNLSATCRTNQEEIFGPLVTITPFRGEAEAVEFANCTPYGLAATVWTSNLDRAHRAAAAIQAGVVWINCWLVRDLRTPFGGMKQSGVGREGGDEALRFFTESKNVCIQLGATL
jgi:aminomuconate-semialdehyde/2-hydroxymuconate-6-semialdehyde dehydrogenase